MSDEPEESSRADAAKMLAIAALIGAGASAVMGLCVWLLARSQ